MILEFSVTNFLSFKDKVTFSMLANASESIEGNVIQFDKFHILRTAAIYGANSSGKSNLFAILKNVVKMLKDSSQTSVNSSLPIIPFLLDDACIDKPSEFEIRFITGGVEYVYGFRADVNHIYEEYLYYYPNGKETKIFYRSNINDYSFTVRESNKLKGLTIKNLPNKFFLATATNWNYDKTKPAYDFLTNSIHVCFDIESLKNSALEMYKMDKSGELKTFALDFFKKVDFNIVDYDLHDLDFDIPCKTTTTIENEILKTFTMEKMFFVTFTHKGLNGNKDISMYEESLGTQMIFYFIPYLYASLNKKSVLVIDELDRSLHPFLVQYIVELFQDKEINKSGSQFIFNTHDTNLLNSKILKRDQIWFTEKDNESGVSDLYPLSDFSVRKKENIERGYLLGRYGAIPFIINDACLWDEE